MTEDPELRRSRIALRLMWLKESGVALDADLAEMVRTWAEEQKEREAAGDVLPTLEDRARNSDDPVAVAELLTGDRDVPKNPWFAFSRGDLVVGWLEEHSDQANELFEALVQRGGGGQTLATRVVAWLSDRANHSRVLRCLSSLARSVTKPVDEYLIGSAARALRVLAEGADQLDGGQEFWTIWSFLVDRAADTSQTVQPRENDPLTDSLNSTGGHLAEALIFRVHREGGEDISGPKLRQRLNALAAGDRDFHLLARTMLASRLPWLHGIDREWARDVLIARMAWSGSEPTNEARALWQGYLWAPHLNPKLLEDLKPAFFQALASDLGLRHDDNLFRLLADLLLKAPDKLTDNEKRSVFRAMPVDGLVTCADYWRQILQAAPQGAADTWREKIGPLIESYWPVVNDKVTPETVEALARLSIQTNDAFPEVCKTLSQKSLLTTFATSRLILHEIANPLLKTEDFGYYDYCFNHPIQTIQVIDQTVDFDKPTFERQYLERILQRVREVTSL